MRCTLLSVCLALATPWLHAQTPAASAPTAPVVAVPSKAPGARLAVPVLPPRVVAATDQAQFRRFVLANGLRVLLMTDAKLNRSSASLVVDVGQIDDPRDSEGLAHFTEHMLFLGTDKYPEEGEYSRFIRSNGGNNNAYTTSDHTNYQFDIRHQALPQALDRFAQFFIAPRFNPEFVGREVSAVHNEAMRHVQNDFRRVWSVLRELYDPASGESKFSTGNKDTLARATPEAVRAFFERHYSADRMALAITGRAGLDELEALARSSFSAIPVRGTGAAAHAPIYLPRKDALRMALVEPVRELRQLQLEFLLPPSRRMFASRSDRLMTGLLEFPGAGGLLAQLKAEGLANNLDANLWERTPQYSSMWVTLDLTPKGEREVATVLNRFFAWAEFLRKSPFPAAFHADRARIGNLEETYADRGEGMGLATQLANQALFFPLDVAERAGSAWGAPDEAAYRSLLAPLVPQNMLVALAARGVKTDRRERIYNVAYSYSEDTGAAFTALTQPQPVAAFALPGANPFMPTSTRLLAADGAPGPAERATALITEPGLVLHYAPDTEFLRPETAILLRFVPVRALGSADSEALLSLWSRALQEALQPDIEAARAAGVRLQFDASLEGLRITVTGYGDSPARVARYLGSRLRDFALTPERFAAAQDQVKRGIASYAQTEAFTLAGHRREAMSREFRYLPPQLQTQVDAATWPDVRRFGQQFMAQGRVEVLVHGHLSSDEAVATARALSASIGARPAEAADLLRRRHLVMKPGEHLVDAGLIEGVNAAWISEYQFGEDSPRLRAASLVLSAFVSPPFSTELRTRQQLGYIVGSGLAVSLRQRGLNFTIQSSTHSTVDIAQRADTFISGLPAALAAVSDSDWAQLKAGVRSQLEQQPKSIGERAERLFGEAYSLDGDWGRNAAALAALPALGKDETVALLTELLDPAKARRRSVMLDPSSKPPAPAVAASYSDREAWKRTRQYR
jgi:insulysin